VADWNKRMEAPEWRQREEMKWLIYWAMPDCSESTVDRCVVDLMSIWKKLLELLVLIKDFNINILFKNRLNRRNICAEEVDYS
jgi:hypothetical protein